MSGPTADQRRALRTTKRIAAVPTTTKAAPIDKSVLGLPVLAKERAPRKRLSRVNPERRAVAREAAFGPHAQWVVSLPCAVAFPELYEGPHTIKPWMLRTGQTRISDPHHVRSRGAGGKAEMCVPLDPPRHRECEAMGRASFEATYKIDLHRVAALLWDVSPVREGR